MEALGEVEHWPVGSAAVGVVRTDPVPIPASTVGPIDQPFPWASVTKPATALAVLVAIEERAFGLDEPAGPPGSTVRHLLAHASGLGAEATGPRVPAGTARIYSNAGYAVLGDLVAERTGMSFGAYLRQGVLEPLGMTSTVLSTEEPAGSAAAGLVGPLGDLLALGRELAVPTLISVQTHRLATSAQFPDLAGVLPGFQRFDPCPWGLGVEVRGDKWPHWTGRTNSPATYGHFGQSGSFLWIDPAAGVLCAGLAARRFGPWATRAWPRLADAVLACASSDDHA